MQGPMPESAPCRYLPMPSGRYQVAAGLHALGCDLGNGALDAKVFQIDVQWSRYRAQKLRARAERLDKYVCDSGLARVVERALTRQILDRLVEEYPPYFSMVAGDAGGWVLHCALSGESLRFNADLDYLGMGAETGSPQPPYGCALDALACQVQEDMAITELDAQADRLSALHLCFPNHWSPQDKIGRGFDALHEPVPGFEKIARQSRVLLRHLVDQGPFVRFAWGLATDRRLNHHPDPPPGGTEASAWRGRRFDLARPRLYVRVERQVMLGMPQVGAFLFTVRTYLEDVAGLTAHERIRLRSAIASMDAQTLRYKGIEGWRDDILVWLQRLARKG
jgi:hypothetical protein